MLNVILLVEKNKDKPLTLMLPPPKFKRSPPFDVEQELRNSTWNLLEYFPIALIFYICIFFCPIPFLNFAHSIFFKIMLQDVKLWVLMYGFELCSTQESKCEIVMLTIYHVIGGTKYFGLHLFKTLE